MKQHRNKAAALEWAESMGWTVEGFDYAWDEEGTGFLLMATGFDEYGRRYSWVLD